jgi:hypothetical protein
MCQVQLFAFIHQSQTEPYKQKKEVVPVCHKGAWARTHRLCSPQPSSSACFQLLLTSAAELLPVGAVRENDGLLPVERSRL